MVVFPETVVARRVAGGSAKAVFAPHPPDNTIRPLTEQSRFYTYQPEGQYLDMEGNLLGSAVDICTF